MSPRWRLTAPALVVAVCAACLLFGSAVVALARLALARAPFATSELIVAVRSGRRAIRVTNLTAASWTGCVITIEGGIKSKPFTFAANATQRIRFDAFDDEGRIAADRSSDFAHAFHMTRITCQDASGQTRNASVR